MTSLIKLEKRITKIESRNERVEIDKSWETSLFRKTLLMVFTYLSISLYMNAINVDNPWLNAVIPTLGFYLSTLTLPLFKAYWVKQIYQTKND
jgi:hypothetical protein